MSDFELIALGDLIQKVKNWNPESSGQGFFTYIDLSAVDQDGKVISGSRSVSCEEAPSRARQLVRVGDVLVSTVRPNLNAVAVVGEELEGATASTGFCVLRPKLDFLDVRYLFHWVRSPLFIKDMVSQATGASYPAISDRIICASTIPLFSLVQQKRIAAILDKADALRAKRRKALEQLDALAQAIFIEMFGDPVLNPKGWETKRLGELGRVVTGNTPSRSRADYYGGEVEWIKSDNINSPSYYLTEAVERLTQAGKAVARVVPAGSVLVTCIAGSPECIGNAGLADREVAFNQQINALVPERVESHFLYAHFLFGKKLVQRASTSGMKGMVSKSKFEEIEFIYPPHELQNEYSQKIRHIQKVRERCQQANAELDALFSSLQHRAFRGEL